VSLVVFTILVVVFGILLFSLVELDLVSFVELFFVDSLEQQLTEMTTIAAVAMSIKTLITITATLFI